MIRPAAIILGVVLLVAGIGHLTTQRIEFRAQVPAWVPVNENFVVIASGLVEISLGLALLLLVKQRAIVGIVVAAFFIAVFPGNIGQYVEHKKAFGLDTDGERLARLFFQPVLVAWALWSTGGWPELVRRVGRGRT